MSTTKKTQGRQKINIKKIDEKNRRQVTFSKRRNGIVNKASELSILCGAEVAVIAFSEGKKMFSFGNPNVDTILKHYIEENEIEEAEFPQEDQRIKQMKNEYEKAVSDLEEEKQKAKKINETRGMDGTSGMFWWDEDIDHMNLQELEEFGNAIEQMRESLSNSINKMIMDKIMSDASLFLPS